MNTDEMGLVYYALTRINEYPGPREFKIVTIVAGDDPLHGQGSWDLFSGPFVRWVDAEQSIF